MILGLVEHDRGKLNEASLEMLTLGRRLAAELGLPLHALLVGDAARPLTSRLGAFGAVVVHLAVHDRLEDYAPDAWAQCAVELAQTLGPAAVLASGTERGSELMARAAARLGLPLAANCIEVRPGEAYQVTRQRWGGSLLEEARLSGAIKLLTVAPLAVAAEPDPAAAG